MKLLNNKKVMFSILVTTAILSAVGFQNFSSSGLVSISATYAGKIQSIILDSENNEFLKGCTSSKSKSQTFEIFRGGKNGDGGVLAGTYEILVTDISDSNLPTLIDNTALTCASNFQLSIPKTFRQNYPGKRLYVYGVDPLTADLILLNSDGGTHIYAPTIFRPETYGTTTYPSDSTLFIQKAITAATNYTATHQAATAEVLLNAQKYAIGGPDSVCGGPKNSYGYQSFCLSFDQTQNVVFGGAGKSTQIILQNPMAGAIEGVGYPPNPAPLNVTLIGLLFDELYPPFTQGTVTAVQGADSTNPYGSVTISIDSGMPLLTNREYQSKYLSGGTFGMLFSGTSSTPQLKPATPDYFCTAPDLSNSSASTNSWRIKASPTNGCSSTTAISSYAKVGDRFIQLARNGIGWITYFSVAKNITYDGVTIYSGPDMSTVWVNNSGFININDLEIKRSPNPQIAVSGYTRPNISGTETYRDISTNGDGAHFTQDWAKPTITNSTFQSIADDGINILSKGLPVAGSGSLSQFSYSDYAVDINPSDELQLVDLNTGITLGQSTVARVTPNTATAGALTTFTVILSSAISGMNSNDSYVVFNLNAAGPNAYINENTFDSVRSHGIFCKSPNAQIRNNTFTVIDAAGVGLYSVLSPAGPEGPNPSGVTVSGNKFSGGNTGSGGQGQLPIFSPSLNGSGYSTVQQISNTTVEANTFSNYFSNFPPVFIGSEKNITLNYNNVISSSGISTGLSPGVTLLGSNVSEIFLNGINIGSGVEPAGLFVVNGASAYYSNGSSGYCGFSDWNQFVTCGYTQAAFNAAPQLTLLPWNMQNGGLCSCGSP